MKLTHTHRGHCQACTKVQAIDPNTGNIAKHGYTVDGGYFSGTCPGSDRRTLHVERAFADEIIVQARADAAAARAQLAQLEQGTAHPVMCQTNEREENTYDARGRRVFKYKMVKWADADVGQRSAAMRDAIWNAKRSAELAESCANDLQKWADKITGKVDAYRVEDLDAGDWKVGDVVRIGGKKGADLTIEAIEDRAYRTHGFSRGSSTVNTPHARVTVPAVTEKKTRDGYVTRKAAEAYVDWVALRNIKRPPTALAAMLKAEGKV